VIKALDHGNSGQDDYSCAVAAYACFSRRHPQSKRRLLYAQAIWKYQRQDKNSSAIATFGRRYREQDHSLACHSPRDADATSGKRS
jgi:hypothetical protein